MLAHHRFSSDHRNSHSAPLSIGVGVLAGTLASAASAAIEFGSAVAYPVGDAPHGIVAVDVDRDACLDLACVNQGGASVTILRGDCAGGSFAVAETIAAVGALPSTIASADFDNDGWPDLAVGAAGDDAVVILMNDRSGGFSVAATVPVGMAPSGLAIGDIDRDGSADLAVSSAGADEVAILLNDGLGGFSAACTIPTGLEPSEVALGDLNRDGFLDLVVTCAGSSMVQVMLWTSAPCGYLLVDQEAIGTRVVGLVLADVDRDADLDVAVACENPDDAVWVLRNDGSGAVVPAGTYPLFDGAPHDVHPQSIVAADVDADGDVDLLTANRNSADLSLLRNDGLGGFGTRFAFAVGLGGRDLAAGDFDRDGLDDVAVAGGSNASSAVAVLANLGSLAATCRADIDEDDHVGFADLLLLLSSWGPCPE